MRTIDMHRNQKGVALFIALIAMVIMMLAAVALIRSTDIAQMISGNLSVKRDLTHESELAMQAALARFATSGTLETESARWNDLGNYYHASALDSNEQGIPLILLKQATSGTGSNETAAYNNGVTYTYVIDRMCPATGSDTTHCASVGKKGGEAIDAFNPLANAGAGLPIQASGVVYRITVRLTDARQTQSFFQTTLVSLGT